MNAKRNMLRLQPRGVTLIEMTIVLMMLLTLVSAGMMMSAKIGDWKLGRDAAETLRTVHAAQRMFLTDNPTTPVSSITSSQLVPYLPKGMTAMPQVTTLTGEQRPIRVNVSPPVIDAGGGVAYDPSGSPNDGLWDIGQ